MIELHCIDNLELMKTIEDDTVDLIYCDILYGTGRKFADYQDLKPIRSEIEAHYIPRIKEMHRILKPTGSIYLQMDTKINHWVRCIMDDIFGYDNFRNVITWQRSNGKNNSSYNYENVSDTIIFYTKSNKYTFNVQKKELKETSIKRYNKVDESSRKYMIANLMDKQSYKGESDVRIVNNKQYKSKNGLGYKWSQEKINDEIEKGTKFVENSEGQIAYIKYLDQSKGANVDNIWSDIYCIINTNTYSTQKPKALIERIIKASSNEGDLVCDFYLGSGTTAEVCKDLNRNFIGCDINPRAIEIAKSRCGLGIG